MGEQPDDASAADMVTPGEVLGKAAELKAGKGAYVAPLLSIEIHYVFSSLNGVRRIISPPIDSADQVRIARIFNTYGPRMCLDDGRVVSNFVAQAIRKQPLTVYGDGKQTRSFQYVSDLVDGLMALMENDHIGPFKLGNPGEFTMLELAEVVKETIDSSATIEFRPNTVDDPHMRKPDITKAKELLNWEPKIPFRKGLPLLVSDFWNRILND